MEADDTRRLRQRRGVLQARLRRHAQARQAIALAPLLRAAGAARISRLPPQRAMDLIAPFAQLPARDERFHWPDIEQGTCVGWVTPAARDATFRRALASCFGGPTRLALVFHTAEYALVLGMDAAIAHATTILDACHDTLWVVARPPGQGLVEVSFTDREVCWGTRLTPLVRAADA